MKLRFRERVLAALRIPSLEALFAEPWPAAARLMLPSYSPQLTATAVWGPVMAWATLGVLAESIDLANPQRTALDLFDRLRLREPLGNVFQALGFEGEEAWRVAARIKVALLVEAKIFTPDEGTKKKAKQPTVQTKAQPAARTIPEIEAPPKAEPVVPAEIPVLSPTLWQDPDVRWLTGAHEAEGGSYFIKESYEELLWWLQLPALCKMGAEKSPTGEAHAIGAAIDQAAEAASDAGYSIEALLSPTDSSPLREQSAVSESTSKSVKTTELLK
jgi:hypothetical protein